MDVAANAGEVKGKLVYVYSTVIYSCVLCILLVFYRCIQLLTGAYALVMNDHTRSRVRVSACTLYSKYSQDTPIMSAAGENFLSFIDSQGDDDDDDDDDIAIYLVRILGPLSPNGFPVRFGP